MNAPLTKTPPRAAGVPVREIRSPGGLTIWHVEDHTLPMLVLRFGLVAGSVQDDPGKAGLNSFLAGLLDEGSGEFDAQTFQEKLEDKAIELSFWSTGDHTGGTLRTLSKYRDDAFAMTRIAVMQPRFDADAIERVRGQIAANIKRESNDPNAIASRRWAEIAYPGHPYGWPSRGTLESVAAITRDDLAGAHRRLFARDTLAITAVGDIDAGTLGRACDDIFGGLPAKAGLRPVLDVAPAGTGQTVVEKLSIPQSVVAFGTNGVSRLDPDYIPAAVLNHILGGGLFQSRLFREVREKRGLAYSVYSQLVPGRHASIVFGSTSTKNERVKESLDVIREQIADLTAHGPTEDELVKARQYMTGSYALSFDSSAKIASELLGIQLAKLGLDYTARRNGLIEAVTLEDTRRVAKRLFGDGKLLVTVVGAPEGL